MTRYYFLSGDRNYRECGGKWFSRDHYNKYPGKGTTYTIIELINWEDSTGEQLTLTGEPYHDYPQMYGGNYRDNKPGKYRYVVQVTRLDTVWYTTDEVAQALECSGWEGMPKTEVATIEALHSYGLGDTLDILFGNNARTLLQQAKGSN